MAVLPANERLDLHLLSQACSASEVELADEEEFKSLFKDCEVGAMPPFGNLYGMPVYLSISLSHEGEIAFNAGSHYELVKLAYPDFERLVKPRVFKLTQG
jgi:Ala-tRNA(Pro) deacylase